MQPGRFLLAVIDGGGTVPPALGVASRLVGRGHAVRVLGDPTVEGSARSAGCAFTPWTRAPRFDSVADQTAAVSAGEMGSPRQRYVTVRDRLLGRRVIADQVHDVLTAVRQTPVDALLVEAAMPGLVLGGEASGLPTAALMANIYMRPAPGLPLFGTGWEPARGRLGAVRDRAAGAAARTLTAGVLARPVNAVREAYGLPPVDDLLAQLDRCARVLVLTSPSFDLAATRLPPNVRYVGPQLDDPDWASDQDWRPPGDAPLVLVAMSSVFQNQTPVLRTVAAALGTLPVRAVLTTGRAVDPEAVPAAGNVRVLRSAPHTQVLAEASVVLTHAGHGTVMKSLAAGVPLVCLPMGRDQRDNTTRVLRLGAGVRVSPTAPAGEIAAAVGRVLGEPAYARAAGRFAEVLAQEAGARPNAADEAEALLRS